MQGKTQSRKLSHTRSGTILKIMPFAMMMVSPISHAVDYESESGLKLRWDNTVKYSVGARMGEQNREFLANPNIDDGNRNFDKHSLVSNRADILSELDVRFGDFGIGLSGAAWYDRVYNKRNDHDSPATSNNVTRAYNEFAEGTRKLSGRRAEILNAFVQGKFMVADAPVNVRIGRHTVLWGESLFFADNGVAYGMAAIDGQKAASVPNTQAKELFLPTNQISTSLVLPAGVSLEAFYQLKWRPLRIPPAGSFFSPADMLADGGESILAPVPGGHILRGRDENPHKKQFGAAIKWRPENANVDLGFYAIRFNEKVPRIFNSLTPTGELRYVHAYQEKIEMYGMSANTSVDALNIGAEVSYRKKQPLAMTTNPALAPLLLPGQNTQHIGPLGDVALFELNWIYAGRAGAFYDNYSIVGAVGGHHLTNITENESAFDKSTNRTTFGARAMLVLDYFQVAPSLDLSVPIGIGWTQRGKSVLPGGFNSYSYGNKAGDISIGLKGTFQQTWKGGITFTQFVGKAESNSFRDRSFISATISNSF